MINVGFFYHPGPAPSTAELSMFLYADGFTPRGRTNVNIKVALVDEVGLLWPCDGPFPCLFLLISLGSQQPLFLVLHDLLQNDLLFTVLLCCSHPLWKCMRNVMMMMMS